MLYSLETVSKWVIKLNLSILMQSLKIHLRKDPCFMQIIELRKEFNNHMNKQGLNLQI